MHYKIYTTSVFEKWPIENKSVQAVITSPPYYSLRKYNIPDIIIGGEKDCEHDFNDNYIKTQTSPSEKSTTIGKMPNAQGFVSISSFCVKCNAWKGQYGLEPDYKLFIDHSMLWIKEVWRVLRDDGIFFLNMGDSYPSGGGKAVEQSFKRQSAIDTGAYPDDNPSAKLRNSMGKCKLLIPHRIAINMIDEGWILRNDIIWRKGNALPESVKDRFSNKTENIFMFVKKKDYYFNLDAVKEPTITKDSILRDRDTTKLNNTPGRTKMSGLKENNYDFKNPGNVWEINTQPSKFKHYAMWPQKLVERMILCSTKKTDIILDPFAGSGTTLKVAIKNNREAIGIDLGYADIQEENLRNIQTTLL